jgi:hypothetical protein
VLLEGVASGCEVAGAVELFGHHHRAELSHPWPGESTSDSALSLSKGARFDKLSAH